MSGPIEERDVAGERENPRSTELREGRPTEVGGLPIRRVLPTKGRRTVGAWCFVDLMGPADIDKPDPMEVGPHPHVGLSTVTWLLEGEALHTDSLGTEQNIRPGQLNLMTAGHGIAHAELAARPPFRGVQMWVAQPPETRHGENAFSHHGELPQTAVEGAEAIVLEGEALGRVLTPGPTRNCWAPKSPSPAAPPLCRCPPPSSTRWSPWTGRSALARTSWNPGSRWCPRVTRNW